MKSYSSKEVIKALLADGWYEVQVTGSHHQSPSVQASYQEGADNGKTSR